MQRKTSRSAAQAVHLAGQDAHPAAQGGLGGARRLVFVTCAVAAFAATAALSACSVQRANHRTTREANQRSTSATEVHPPQTPPVSTDGTYAVGTTTLQVVEPGSSSGAPGRTLPTTVWYPATEAGAGTPSDRSHAPYPLLVFSQGYDLSADAYQALLRDWASAGFTVAAPTYPHTDPSDPALNETDIVNHPADLRSVITTVLGAGQQPGTMLSGLIASGGVGIVGHSDGGDVSLAVADNSCCQDPRVKAAAILSGAEYSGFGGSYFAGSPVPLLVVQGNEDTINVPACSAQSYNAAHPPKYYLDLLGAAHGPPYVDPGTYQTTVAHVVTDFFDAELSGQRAATAAMTADGNVAGAASITTASTAPVAPGTCPDAP